MFKFLQKLKFKGVTQWHVDDLKKYDDQKEINGRYVTARPEGVNSHRHRLKCAWKVLTGQADVVTFTNQ